MSTESTTPLGQMPLTASRGSGWIPRTLRRHPWLNEWLIFLAALVVYQGSRAIVIGNTTLAFTNADGIINWEKTSGLFVELSIQQWLLNHLVLTKLLNDFYMTGHWVVTPLFFIWLYRRRRTLYPYIRNAFLVANAIALTIYIVFPVAPPRMLTSNGFVDTLGGVSQINLHGGMFSRWFNAEAAIPSMHFGYSFMIGVVGALLVRHWALRLLALSYPVLVFITITGTANHYVADSLAGALVMAAGFVGVQLWMVVWPRIQPSLRARFSRDPVPLDRSA